jgi:AcrR family transcriptional regulator
LGPSRWPALPSGWGQASSPYKHFGDRSELLAAAATDAALDLGRTLWGAVERSGADPNARLQALAAAF